MAERTAPEPSAPEPSAPEPSAPEPPAPEPAPEPSAPRPAAPRGDERPERLLIAARLDTPAGPRFVLVRWPDWPHPALLSAPAPGRAESLIDTVATVLGARLRLRPLGEPRAAESRRPVRMAHPRFGGAGLGWLRPVAVTVAGEPQPDALLEGVETLTLEEALAALPTELERALLREAAALLD